MMEGKIENGEEPLPLTGSAQEAQKGQGSRGHKAQEEKISGQYKDPKIKQSRGADVLQMV